MHLGEASNSQSMKLVGMDCAPTAEAMAQLRTILLVSAVVVGTVYAGCTVDKPKCYVDVSSRILGDSAVFSGSLTQEYCAQLCANKKMSLAGVENGNECYCGNAVKAGAATAADTDCNTGCLGNPREKCGGNWRIGVSTFKCSGAPVPQPSEPPEMVNPCKTSKFSKMPFCNTALAIDDRVADAVSRMTLQEKIANLDTGGAPIESLGLNGYVARAIALGVACACACACVCLALSLVY